MSENSPEDVDVETSGDAEATEVVIVEEDADATGSDDQAENTDATPGADDGVQDASQDPVNEDEVEQA